MLLLGVALLQVYRFSHNIGEKSCVFSRPGRLLQRGRVHATFTPDIMGKTLLTPKQS